MAAQNQGFILGLVAGVPRTSRSFSTQSTHAGLAESIAPGKVKEAEIAATEHQEVLAKILR